MNITSHLELFHLEMLEMDLFAYKACALPLSYVSSPVLISSSVSRCFHVPLLHHVGVLRDPPLLHGALIRTVC